VTLNILCSCTQYLLYIKYTLWELPRGVWCVDVSGVGFLFLVDCGSLKLFYAIMFFFTYYGKAIGQFVKFSAILIVKLLLQKAVK